MKGVDYSNWVYLQKYFMSRKYSYEKEEKICQKIVLPS